MYVDRRDATAWKPTRKIRVQCFPLYAVLQAIGNPKVDYFSLDIEGGEYRVIFT